LSSGSGTLGKYQIIREIARSNDIVYEAWDPEMNRRVAVKELNMPGGLGDKQRADRVDRFKREANAAGRLAHPNIVTIYEIDDDAGRLYIAMEYLDGQTLRQRIDAEGPIDQEVAVKILCEVLAGLQYAHENGVIHRDIKPDNIQLLPDGRVKITDFGIARLTFEPSLTMDGQIFGTPSYMSPEQIHGRDIDAHTDIFSAGIVLWEAISGQKPFVGDSVVAISHSILHLEPPDPPHASYPIVRLLRIALDKSPSQRFTSAKAMASELTSAIESLKADPSGAAAANPYSSGPAYTQPGPYDPYAQGSPYAGQYSQTHAPVPPVLLPPAWTAPPPKKPLLTPEAAEFLRKTTLVVLIGGAIIAAGAAGIWALNTAAGRARDEASDERSFGPSIDTAVDLGKTDVSGAIDRLESIFDDVQSDSAKRRVGQELARQYIVRAQAFEASNDFASAEKDYMRAASVDTANPYPLALAGRALREFATRASDVERRAALLDESRLRYQDAVDRAAGTQAEAQYRREYARACIVLAKEFIAANHPTEAKALLNQAINSAPGSSEASEAASLMPR
jgi:serine/threonine-protein kinase